MKYLFGLIGLLFLLTGELASQSLLTGELRKWHKITLTFDGPSSSEEADPNPFTDYRLEVTFSNGESTYVVPGYFAADGNAAETGAFSGDKWRVHFSPDATGTWNWAVSFRTGPGVALSQEAGAGSPGSLDGLSGSFDVLPSNKSGRDLRARGRLQYVGGHYLRFAETGEYFLKIGADAPENLLAYNDFDNTPDNGGRRKSWGPHLQDWEQGDPTWDGGKGKGIIGAINYLAAQGQNAFSFLTMNIGGDDKNVFPYISDNGSDRLRMDCSKLAQWEILFEHAQEKGMYLHFKTQETENDQLLDGGDLGPERKLYYRELIARFGHHLALNWNLGEENTNTSSQQKAFAQYFRDLDPYDHHIVIHTYPGQDDKVYTPLLGDASLLTGASLQVGWSGVHQRTVEWVEKSRAAGKKWVTANDEQGSASIGVPEDGYSGTPNHDDIRAKVLWGHLLANGAGVEYYFGYQRPHSDLTCEDFRSRSNMWVYNRHAHTFFTDHLPFWEMDIHDELVGNANHSGGKYCFARPGEIYAVYLPDGGTHDLDLQDFDKTFSVDWYDPRNGGDLIPGGTITGPGTQSLGTPPADAGQDWVVLIRADQADPPPPSDGFGLVDPGDQEHVEGTVIQLAITAEQGTEPFSFTATGLPPGLQIDPATGVISGEAPVDSASSGSPYEVRVKAVDSSDPPQADSVSFQWFILPAQTCPPAGTACDDGDPATENDQEDGNCQCAGEVPPAGIVLSNPGDQTNREGDEVSLPLPSEGGTPAYTYSATGLPPGLEIDPETGLISGTLQEGTIIPGSESAFLETEGLVLMEVESVPFQEDGWIEKTEGGVTYYEGAYNSLGNPQTDVLDFPIRIETSGVYRFVWRSNILLQDQPTEHNDSWLKFPNTGSVVYFGYKGSVSGEQDLVSALENENNIVYPKGSGLEGAGTSPNGGGGDGFFKIYRSGKGEWKWQSRTSDNDAHNIYVWFKEPGEYLMQVSNRSQGHKIDKMALHKIDLHGNNLSAGELDALPESSRGATGGTVLPGASENSPYLVTVVVTDSGDPARADTIQFTWTILSEQESCPPAGTPCDDGEPDTINDAEDGDCTCAGEPVPMPPPEEPDTIPPSEDPGPMPPSEQPPDQWLEAECGDLGNNWIARTDPEASNETYITPAVSKSSLLTPPEAEEDQVRIRLTVSEAGYYHIFARSLTTGDKDDSFWIRVNEDDWVKWNKINADPYQEQYRWDRAEGELEDNRGMVDQYYLEAGLNTIYIAWREPNIQFDKLLVRKVNEEPEGLGGTGLLCTVTGLDPEVLPPLLAELRVFPVPAREGITMEGQWNSRSEAERPDRVVLFNSVGQLVLERILPEGNQFRIDIPVGNLEQGLYLLRLGEVSKRVLIIR